MVRYFAILILPWLAFAQPNTAHDQAFMGNLIKASSEVTLCGVSKDTLTGSTSDVLNCADTTSDKYWAQKFTAGSTYTLCQITLRLKRGYGSPTYTYYASIYSDSSGTPGSMIGSEKSISGSVVTSSEADVAFTGYSTSIVNGTVYWVVLRTANVDVNNYVEWCGAGSGTTKYSSNASSWTSSGADNKGGKFTLYGN